MQNDETLRTICGSFYGDSGLANAVASWNQITDANSIEKGQRVALPSRTSLVNASFVFQETAIVEHTNTVLATPTMGSYTVKSGDYLQKIARQFNTTIALIKKMNNMQTDTIRIGARLIVFEGSFTILVSKKNNLLDLLLNGQLFKRYPVGTGKFGKTPASDFFIYDKIIEPPWTRPADNRLIEYGDPENVLGTRWMALRSAENTSLKGFGIHGTWERDSIGAQSSAGCIRMFNEDVEELFDIVPRKSRVRIEE